MSIRTAIGVIRQLVEDGVISQYAVAGAIAALNYIETSTTEDIDILVSITSFESRPSGLLLLTPIDTALERMGYSERTDVGYKIGDWPVQFLPVASALDEEALERAIEVPIEIAGNPPPTARLLRAEYVVATAAKLGRFKDYARIEAFLEQKAVNLSALKDVLIRHALMDRWDDYCKKAGIVDPLG